MGFTFLLLALSVVAEARSKGIPLMPAKDPEIVLTAEELQAVNGGSRYAFTDSRDNKEAHRPRSRAISYAAYTSKTSKTSRTEPSKPFMLGLEIGTQGRASTTSPDLLGLKLMWGIRAFAVLPASKNIFLKPSLGYFFRKEGAGKVGVAENMAEAGLAFQYAFSRTNGFTWMVGLVNRFELAFAKTSISALTASDAPSSTSDSSALVFRYRLGPSLGMTYRLTPEVGLLLDVEATFSITEPVRPYGGVVTGLIFRL